LFKWFLLINMTTLVIVYLSLSNWWNAMYRYKLTGLAALLLGLSFQMPAYAAVGDNISLKFHNITTPAVASNVTDGQTNLLAHHY
jgi:hypothetical protein